MAGDNHRYGDECVTYHTYVYMYFILSAQEGTYCIQKAVSITTEKILGMGKNLTWGLEVNQNKEQNINRQLRASVVVNFFHVRWPKVR